MKVFKKFKRNLILKYVILCLSIKLYWLRNNLLLLNWLYVNEYDNLVFVGGGGDVIYLRYEKN